MYEFCLKNKQYLCDSSTGTSIFDWGTVLNCIYLDLNIICLVNKNCYLKPNNSFDNNLNMLILLIFNIKYTLG